jgi:hypothetical protein
LLSISESAVTQFSLLISESAATLYTDEFMYFVKP